MALKKSELYSSLLASGTVLGVEEKINAAVAGKTFVLRARCLPYPGVRQKSGLSPLAPKCLDPFLKRLITLWQAMTQAANSLKRKNLVCL